MQPIRSGPQNRPRSLEEWEEEISRAICQEKARVFGEQTVAVNAKSLLGKKIDRFVSNLLKEFPCTANGSRFVHSTFTALPQLVIRYSDLQPVFKREKEGNLFLKEIGKSLEIEPLSNSFFGSITQESTHLELLDLRFANNAKLLSNSWSTARVFEESDLAVVNHPKTIGEVDVDPNLQQIQLTATVRFGAFQAKDQEIVAETRDGQSLDLIIPLPHLSLTGKIGPDGVVKLQNKRSFPIDELIGPDPVTWIDISHILNLQFDLRHAE